MVVSAPGYNCADDVVKPSVRFLGVSSMVNHTANTQIDGVSETYSNMISSYNDSPLASRTGQELSEDYFGLQIMDIVLIIPKIRSVSADFLRNESPLALALFLVNGT